MTSPDNRPLSAYQETQGQPVGDWNMLLNLGKLGERLILWPLSYLLAWVLGGTPQNWDTLAELQANLIPALMRLPIKILAQLLGLIPIVGQNIENALTDYLAATANTASTASSVAASAQTAADAAGAKGQSIVDKIVQGLGGSGTGHTVDDVKTRLEAIGTATPATPAYVADIQDMATVPRSMVVGWDTHTISGCGVVTSQSGLPTYTPDRVFTTGTASSYVDYTPIVVDRSGVLRKLRWIVGADTSIFAIDDYRMALCAYNPANGNIEKVWDSGNIKDGVANTTTLKEVEIDMGISQVCTPGQILFVAHMQLAPGFFQATRSFAAAGQAGIARPSTLLLDACTYRTSSRQTGIPSSIALAGMTRINNRIPWAAVSVDTSGGS